MNSVRLFLMSALVFALLLGAPHFSLAAESDGDGISDEQELIDGTDPSDSGSFKPQQQQVFYSPWNGFLEMTNILELLNPGSEYITVALSLFLVDGTEAHSESFILLPGMEQDLIINDMKGFEKDTYGLLRISISGPAASRLDGRMMYYGYTGTAGEYSFAMPMPFVAPMQGVSAVSFNTMQPSFNPRESGNLVTNWLSIINLSSQTRIYSVEKRDQAGQLLSNERVTVESFGRRDVDGGHENPGQRFVGALSIRPEDLGAPYLAFLNRYGYDTQYPMTSSKIVFATSLFAKKATGVVTNVMLDTSSTTQNWLELVNTAGREVQANVQFYGANGNLAKEERTVIPAFSQKHIDVNAIIGAETFGYAAVSSDTKESLVAQSMFYSSTAPYEDFSDVFSSMQAVTLPAPAVDLTDFNVGDINKDGWQDLAVVTSSYTGPDTVYVYFNQGGVFSLHQVLNLPGPPKWLASIIRLEDFNADGWLDLWVHRSYTYATVPDTFYLNDRSGNFIYTAADLSNVSAALQTGTLNDVNRDGLPDLIEDGTYSFEVSYSNGLLRFPEQWQNEVIGSQPPFHPSRAFDYDGDGDLDYLMVASTTNCVISPTSVFCEQGGHSEFIIYERIAPWHTVAHGPFQFPIIVDSDHVFVSDVSGDSLADLVAVGERRTDGGDPVGGPSWESDRVALLFNNGNGTFTTSAVRRVNYLHNSSCAFIADFDNDGDKDIIIDGLYNHEAFANDGSGNLSESQLSPSPHSLSFRSSSLECGSPVDFNHDGLDDLVGVNHDQGWNGPATISIALNNGSAADALLYPKLAGSSVAQSRETFADIAGGSYNMFLAMKDLLRLSNDSDEEQLVTVELKESTSPMTIYSQIWPIEPHETLELPLHNTAQFHTAADTYGSIAVIPNGSGRVFANVLRKRFRPGTDSLQFSVPTAVK